MPVTLLVVVSSLRLAMTAMAVVVPAVIRRLIVPGGAMVGVRRSLLGAVVVSGPGLVVVTMAQAQALRQIASGQDQDSRDQQDARRLA